MRFRFNLSFVPNRNEYLVSIDRQYCQSFEEVSYAVHCILISFFYIPVNNILVMWEQAFMN